MDNFHSPEEKKLADVVGEILKNGNGKGSHQFLIYVTHIYDIYVNFCGSGNKSGCAPFSVDI